MATTTTATTTIGAMEQEWRHIQQEDHLPRKIERYHDFQERFQREHATHLAQCEHYEQRLRDPDGARSTPGTTASISELWALLTSVERDILAHVKAAEALDATTTPRTSHDHTDPLEQAFTQWSQYEAICAQLQQRFAGSLHVTTDADKVSSPSHANDGGTAAARDDETVQETISVTRGVRRSRRRTTAAKGNAHAEE